MQRSTRCDAQWLNHNRAFVWFSHAFQTFSLIKKKIKSCRHNHNHCSFLVLPTGRGSLNQGAGCACPLAHSSVSPSVSPSAHRRSAPLAAVHLQPPIPFRFAAAVDLSTSAASLSSFVPLVASHLSSPPHPAKSLAAKAFLTRSLGRAGGVLNASQERESRENGGGALVAGRSSFRWRAAP
jgi:hypothetical protein